ncbi:MAG: sugar phosphate isomerase/epimerase family protein [Halobacteriaceae archaeon]
MEFGLNAMCFPHGTLEDDLAVAAEAGYDGVELSLDADALGDEERVAEMRSAVEDHGLTVPSVLTPAFWETPLSSTDAATRERGVERGRDLITAAADLGAETVLVVPGVVDEQTPYDVAYENALEGVRALADHAYDLGVTVAVENVWNDLLLSPLEFAEFVDRAGEAGPVGAYFDVGNVLRFGYPEQWIRILADRIAAVHVKDYDTDVDTAGGFTYPLQGDVDWDAVVEALDDVGYDGWVTPEVPPYESHPERMPAQVRDNLAAVFE